MRRCGLVILTLLTLADLASAQSFYAVRRERSLILVAGTGTSTYFGELANPGDYLDAKPNVNAGLQYFFGNRISARAEVTWFTLKGSDAAAGDPGRVPRNLSFSSNNYEISATGAFNFLPNGDRHYRRPNVNIYAFAGIGVMYYNPTTIYQDQGEKVALRPLQTELVKYSSFGVVIPYGLGVRLKITPNINIAIEGGYRKTFTDYLDDVSTVHQDPTQFTDPVAAALSDRRPEIGLPLAPVGFIRGNPKHLDGYMLLNAKLEYYLPWDFSRKPGNPSFYKKRKPANYRYKKGGGLSKKRRK
jgi:hypothetical protein